MEALRKRRREGWIVLLIVGLMGAVVGYGILQGEATEEPTWLLAALILVVILGVQLLRLRTLGHQVTLGERTDGADRLVFRRQGVEVGVLLLESGAATRRVVATGRGVFRIPWQRILEWKILPRRRRQKRRNLPPRHEITLQKLGVLTVNRACLEEGNHYEMVDLLEDRLGPENVEDRVARNS